MRPVAEMLSQEACAFAKNNPRYVRIDMGPVSHEVATSVMRLLLAPCQGGAPEPLVEAGVRLAGGNVGLLQAMVRLFHDSGVLEEADALAKDPVWLVRMDKLESVRLPVTVEDTVSMRIAALTPNEQSLLGRAAAMGSVFWVGALIAIERAGRKVPIHWELDRESEVDSIELLLESLEERDYVHHVAELELPGRAAILVQAQARTSEAVRAHGHGRAAPASSDHRGLARTQAARATDARAPGAARVPLRLRGSRYPRRNAVSRCRRRGARKLRGTRCRAVLRTWTLPHRQLRRSATDRRAPQLRRRAHSSRAGRTRRSPRSAKCCRSPIAWIFTRRAARRTTASAGFTARRARSPKR